MLEIERDSGCIYLAECRQDFVNLRPLQVDQYTLGDARLLDDFATGRRIGMLTPLEASSDRLPKARWPPAFQQQVFAALSMNDD